MAQSYSNTSVTTITAATDEITGVVKTSQQLGTSISAEEPAATGAAGLTLSIRLDQETLAQNITLDAWTNLYDVAAEIQADVRALSPLGFADPDAFNNFVARYDENLNKIVLISGMATVDPANAEVEVTGGTAAAPLKLGTPQGGTEAWTGSEVISYDVSFRFVYDGGARFGGAVVTVNSSELATPTDLGEVETIATARASQLKAEAAASAYTVAGDQSINGPVSL